jgi:hypothetical protein
LDHWQEEGLHFFVFALRHEQRGSAADGSVGRAVPADLPVAVFAMHPEETVPVSAVVVTPMENGEAEVLDLRRPESAYTAPYPQQPETVVPVAPTASRAGVAADSSVLVTGEATQFDALQWQIAIAADPHPDEDSHWQDLAGETATTLRLSPATIESAATASRTVTNGVRFAIGAESYAGTIYEASVRLRAERVVNGTNLSENSPPVSVKCITASGPCT